LAGAVFGLALVGLLLTYTRAAWLAFCGGLVLSAVLFLKREVKGPALDLLRLVTAGLVLLIPLAWQQAPYLGSRLNAADSFSQVAVEQRSIAERMTLNQAVLDLIKQCPWTGVGLGTLARAATGSPLTAQPVYGAGRP
jgi:O-antigen ligase